MIKREILSVQRETCRTSGDVTQSGTIRRPAKHCLNKKQMTRCFPLSYMSRLICVFTLPKLLSVKHQSHHFGFVCFDLPTIRIQFELPRHCP